MVVMHRYTLATGLDNTAIIFANALVQSCIMYIYHVLVDTIKFTMSSVYVHVY